jgi:tetratricopeptide (TPR) repeat protein
VTDWSSLSRAGRDALSRARRSGRPLRDALRAEAAADPENPFTWHAAAVHEARVVRSIPNAHRVLDAAMDAVPRGRRAALYLARAEITADRDAIAVLRSGMEEDATHAPLYWALANVHSRLGDVNAARRVFQDAVDVVPNGCLAQVMRSWAVFEYNHGFPEASRDLWRRAVEIDPSDAKAWRRLAEAEENTGGGHGASLAILERALAVHSTNSELRVCIARLQERTNGPGSSRRYLEDPCMRRDENVQRALAMLEVRERNYGRARQLFRHSADLEAAAQAGGGGAGRGGGDSGGDGGAAGAGAVGAGVAGSPGGGWRPRRASKGHKSDHGPSAKSLHAWALMEAKLGDVDAARELLEEAKGQAPDDPAIWRALAEIESRERNFGAARRAFQRSVAVDDSDMRLWLAWGKTEALAGNFADAERLLLTAVDRFERVRGAPPAEMRAQSKVGRTGPPDTASTPAPAPIQSRTLAEALKELSAVAVQLGDVDRAVALLEQATTADPTFDQAWRALSEHVLRLQGIGAVRDMYGRALNVCQRTAHARLLHWWALDERQAKCIGRARTLLQRATRAEPEYMSAWLSWALLEKSQGDADRACELFEEAAVRATRSSLRSPFIFQAWGRVEELVRGDADKARRVFARGCQLSPDSGMLLQARAQLEDRCGQVDAARRLLAKAAELEPQNGFIWQSWGMVEARRRKYDRATELFERGVSNDPMNAAILSSWAMMEGRDIGNAARGRELFERATVVDPQYAPAWHSWGTLEVALHSYDRARELYQRAAELGPGDPVSWHALGMLEGEHSPSLTLPVEYFKKAIEADPSHAISYQSWALFTERREHNVAAARDLYAAGIERCASSGQAVLYQAWALMEQRHADVPRARELLQRGLEVERRSPELWASYALLEKASGNRKAARRLFRDGCSVATPVRKVASLYAGWGAMEAELGNWDEARALFERGIRLNPGHAPCWLSFASMEERLGNTEKAAELRQSASGPGRCVEFDDDQGADLTAPS